MKQLLDAIEIDSLAVTEKVEMKARHRVASHRMALHCIVHHSIAAQSIAWHGTYF